MYTRKVNYYETDQMAIVHHTNYIRWFEEARVHWLEINGCPLTDFEAKGIQIPVVDVYCKYIYPARFGDEISVNINIEKYTGTRLDISYEVFIEGELLCVTGTSKHCFINSDGRVVSLKKENSKLHKLFERSLQKK